MRLIIFFLVAFVPSAYAGWQGSGATDIPAQTVCYATREASCAAYGGTPFLNEVPPYCAVQRPNGQFVAVFFNSCEPEPEPEGCEYPKTGTYPNCSCPAPGTLSNIPIGYDGLPKTADGATIIGAPISWGGCEWSGWNSQPVDLGNGNSCIQQPDGQLTCWAYLRSAGNEIGQCTDCVNGTPVEGPQQAGEPETGTQTTTDPQTGATTTTNTETTRQVNPDGSTTETQTTTTSQTDGSGTTTTVTTKTINRSTSGTTTTTTQTDVTGPDGITHTTVTGSFQSGTGPEDGSEGEGSGQCDPTAANYLQCVQMLEEIAEGRADQLIGSVDDAGTAALDQWETATQNLIGTGGGVDTPSAIENAVSAFIPSPVGCTDLSMSYKGHTMTLSCAKLEPLRQWLGWLFAVGAALTVFYIALRPQTT